MLFYLYSERGQFPSAKTKNTKNTEMKKYILTIECDMRDIQDFSAIIEDNSTVCNMLVRNSSDSWTFWSEESDEVEEMQDTLDEMVSDSGSGVQIYCDVEERNFLTAH